MKKTFRAILNYLKTADMLLLILCCISTIYGVILIYSATKSSEAGSQQLTVQISSLILGLLLFVVFSLIDIEVIADKWKVLFIFNVLFLLLLVPFGVGDNAGNRNWLRFLGIGIQPAEVVKVTFTIMMARHIQYLRTYKDLNSLFSITQLLVHFTFMFGLIMVISKDLGNALVYFFIFLVLLYAGGVKLRWFLLGGALLGVMTPVAWQYLLRDYQKNRILAPYFPDVIDPTAMDIRWQSYRSKLAIASGQWTGQGLGQGTQTQAGNIPAQHTDFIFSVAGEELGFIGCLVIILLLAGIILRCIYVGSKARNQLSALFCMGTAAMLIIQTVENIGMCVELTPVIGITLPFFSSGGSSIITLFAAMGIVCGVKMRSTSPWKRPL